MTHEERESLRLGKMVIAMIRDVLSAPSKDEAIASRPIRTRDGGRVYLALFKERQTLADLESVVAKRMDMKYIHMRSPGFTGEPS